MFVDVMLKFVGVMNISQVQKIRFVVKIFRSSSNQFLVIFIRSSKLASMNQEKKIFNKAQFLCEATKTN